MLSQGEMIREETERIGCPMTNASNVVLANSLGGSLWLHKSLRVCYIWFDYVRTNLHNLSFSMLHLYNPLSLLRNLNLPAIVFLKSRVHNLRQTNRITKYNTDLFQRLPFRL
jgi:hypothetical protein